MEKLQGSIGEHIQNSINNQGAKSLQAIPDCANFDFDVKILEIKGSICKSGKIDVVVKAAGFEIEHLQVDLSSGAYCNKISVGVEEVQYCFYLQDSCLYTKGYIDGWLHSKVTWDEKIVCI